jgi:hypothetical protein
VRPFARRKCSLLIEAQSSGHAKGAAFKVYLHYSPYSHQESSLVMARLIYVVTAIIALHRSVFVLIVQLFQREPALKALAQTQSELPFVVRQIIALTLFVVLATIASRRSRIMPIRTAIASG